MPTFELSLSESLLLGFCTEEYQRAGPSIFEVFERRLRPFVPLLTQTKTKVVYPNDLPDDIEWYAITAVVDVPQPNGREKRVKSRSFTDRPPIHSYHFLPSDSDPFDEAGAYLGRARSSPKIVFLGGDWRVPGRPIGLPADRLEDGRVVRVGWDTTRQSLIDLTLEHVHREAGAMDERIRERRAIAVEQRWLWDFANRMDESWNLSVAPNFIVLDPDDLPWWPFLDGSKVRIFGLSDRLDLQPDTEKQGFIFQAIETLVNENKLGAIFEAGRCFSRLAYQAETFERRFGLFCILFEQDPYEPTVNLHADDLLAEVDPIHDQLISCLKELAELHVVQRCYHASSLIREEICKRVQLGGLWQFAFWERDEYAPGPVPSYGEDIDGIPAEAGEYTARFSGAVASSWLAFGDVLATLRDIDAATIERVKPLPSLRSYQLSGGSSVDRIRAALQLAEQELANESDASHHPENVIAAVAHGIEGLARRLWPEEIPANETRRGNLVGVLNDKRRHGSNELENRFANLALALYTGYRNPAIHDLDHFRCTWAEARLFVSGMRVLFDISEQAAPKDE